MKIENVEVFGFRAALRGMRNPMNSWDKSDTKFEIPAAIEIWGKHSISVPEGPVIGEKDLQLACKLIKAGSEHRKFLRQIQIWMDITIPRYVWQELDTYKVATVRNSCSTMHKLGHTALDQSNFELPIDVHLLEDINNHGALLRDALVMKNTKHANVLRRELKNMLPEGFLQKATYSFNYETALTMYYQRKSHRLPEWNENEPGSICAMLWKLPYMDAFIGAKVTR